MKKTNTKRLLAQLLVMIMTVTMVLGSGTNVLSAFAQEGAPAEQPGENEEQASSDAETKKADLTDTADSGAGNTSEEIKQEKPEDSSSKKKTDEVGNDDKEAQKTADETKEVKQKEPNPSAGNENNEADKETTTAGEAGETLTKQEEKQAPEYSLTIWIDPVEETVSYDGQSHQLRYKVHHIDGKYDDAEVSYEDIFYSEEVPSYRDVRNDESGSQTYTFKWDAEKFQLKGEPGNKYKNVRFALYEDKTESRLSITPVELQISAENASADYARTALYGTVKVTDEKGTPLTDGFKIRYTSSNAGSSYATEGELTWEEWNNKTRIKQDGGYDITQPYRFAAGTSTVTVQAIPTSNNYTASDTVTYTLTVGKTDGITIAAESGTYVYDGQPHGAKSISFSSAHNHTPTVEYSTDGGQTWVAEEPKLTNVGTMDVTVRASFKNYNSAEATYTVTVTKKPLGIKASNLTSRYQGKEIKQPSYYVYNWTEAKGDKVVSVTNTTQDAEGNTVAAVDVGTYKNVSSEAQVTNAAGEDVTGNYDIKYYNGEIKIEPRRMRLEVRDAQKLFGEPDPAYSIIEHGPDGKVPGQTFFTGQDKYVRKSTDGYHERAVGEYEVTINNPKEGVVFDAEGNDVTKNYEITVTPGTLTIKENGALIPVKVRYSSNSYPFTGEKLNSNQMFETIVNNGEPVDGLTFTYDGQTYTVSTFLPGVTSDGLATGPGSVIVPEAAWGMDVEDAIGRFSRGAVGIFDAEGNDVNGTVFYWDGFVGPATNGTGPSIAPLAEQDRISVRIEGLYVKRTYTGEEISLGAEDLFQTVVTLKDGTEQVFPGLKFEYMGIKLTIKGGPANLTAKGTEVGTYATNGSLTFPIRIVDERGRNQNGQLFTLNNSFNGATLQIVPEKIPVIVRYRSGRIPYAGSTVNFDDLLETEVNGVTTPGLTFEYEGQSYTVTSQAMGSPVNLYAGMVMGTEDENGVGGDLTGRPDWFIKAFTAIKDSNGNNVNSFANDAEGTLFYYDGTIKAAKGGSGLTIEAAKLYIHPGNDRSGGDNYYSKSWDGSALYPDDFYVYTLDADGNEVRVTDGINITYSVQKGYHGPSYAPEGTLTWEEWENKKRISTQDGTADDITQPYRSAVGKPIITVTAKPVDGNTNYTESELTTYTLEVKSLGKLKLDTNGVSETATYDGNAHYGYLENLKVTGENGVPVEGAKILYKKGKEWVETKHHLYVAGTNTVTVKAVKNGYEESDPASFTITVKPRVITVNAGDHVITYGDALPSFNNYTIQMDGQTFKFDDTLLGISGNQKFEKLTLGVSEAQNGTPLNAGTYDIKVLEKEIQRQPHGPYPTTQSFDIQVTGKLTVKPVQLQIEAENVEYIYDHRAHYGNVQVKDVSGAPITNGFKIQYENLDSPGSYAFAGKGELTWTEWSAKKSPKTENGVKEAVQPYRTIAGTAKVKVTIVPDDQTNYVGDTAEYTITVRPYPLTVTLNNASMTYGDPSSFAVTVENGKQYTVSEMPRGDSPSFRIDETGLSFDRNVGTGLNAGTYDDKVVLENGIAIEYNSANGWVDVTRNFDITEVPGTLTVGKRPLTVMVENARKVYGEKDPAFTVKADNLVNADNLATLSGKRTRAKADPAKGYAAYWETEKPGSYGITLDEKDIESLKDNYDITVIPGILTIEKRPLILTVENATVALDELGTASFTVTAEGLAPGDSYKPNGDELKTEYLTFVMGDGVTPTAAGEYPITVTWNAEKIVQRNPFVGACYNISVVPGTLTVTTSTPITPAPVTPATPAPGPTLTVVAPPAPAEVPAVLGEVRDEALVDATTTNMPEVLGMRRGTEETEEVLGARRGQTGDVSMVTDYVSIMIATSVLVLFFFGTKKRKVKK